jgi:hypothetical protein
MSFTKSKIFKGLLGPVLVFFCVAVLQSSPRMSAAILLLVLFGCYIRFLFTSKTKWLRLVFVAFLVTAFLPIDISLLNYPGPPRFVPLIMGAPGPEVSARWRRGEVVLGGCIMRSNAPRWVLVW